MLKPLVNRLAPLTSVNNSTSLITFYVPSTHNLVELNKMVNLEMSKTSNIKSRQTRQGVQDALQAVSTHIKRLKTLPLNGIAIFTGPTMEGFESTVVEPPHSINRFFYRCDSSFYV